jgi:hypothetical protein
MLNREEAQAALKKAENPRWVEDRVASANRLPEPARAVARTLLGVDTRPITDMATREEFLRRLRVGFTAMDADTRRELLEALFPGMGSTVEHGWRLHERLPYQMGEDRRGYRAPGNFHALLERRILWIWSVVRLAGPYPQGVAWFAAWAPHLMTYTGGDTLGILLAAAMDEGGEAGEEVFQTLCASARGEHPVGAMGRHLVRAMLSASRPDGWEFMERLLLAAQREEGFRQSILECVDEAHPRAFRRMLRLILDHDLSRFSATVRAFDTWLGYRWDVANLKAVNAAIGKLLAYLEDPEARLAAMRGKDAEQAYLALWTQAFEDADAVVAPAAELMRHPRAEHRFVGAHLLDQLRLPASFEKLLDGLEDEDLRVANRTMGAFLHGADESLLGSDLFERLERLLPRFPERVAKLGSIVWPWTESTVSRETVAEALANNLGHRNPTRLIPHLASMGASGRADVVARLAARQPWDPATRETLFSLIGDPSRQVSEAALSNLGKCRISVEEAVAMEELLERKSGTLRRGVLTLLSLQPDAEVLASADRLLGAKGRPSRLAGLELLRSLVEGKRATTDARARGERHRAEHPVLSDAERQQLDVVLAAGVEPPTRADALGLIRHEDRTWPDVPVVRDVRFHSSAARRIVQALDDLFVANAQEIVTFRESDGEVRKCLLAELRWGIPNPDPRRTFEEDLQRLPLADVWMGWWRTRGPGFRDADGMELLRACAWHRFTLDPYDGPGKMLKAFPEVVSSMFGDVPTVTTSDRWKVRSRAASLLSWLLRMDPPAGSVDFLLDAAEGALALLPPETLLRPEREPATEAGGATEGTDPETGVSWRDCRSPFQVWFQVADMVENFAPGLWSPEQQVRRWRLLRWVDEPFRPREFGGGEAAPTRSRCLPRHRADIKSVTQAYRAGGATEADVVDHLIGAAGGSVFRGFDLGELTRRKPKPDSETYEILRPIVDRCRRRILEVELTRGDNPTVATPLALELGSVNGIDDLMAILRALGKGGFVRGGGQDLSAKETVLSHLVRCSFPLGGETGADFRAKALAAKIPEQRLVELAVYAPQWARCTEEALGWEGLADAVWWIHAHTKGTDWTVENEIRELWQADLSARTALSPTDLLEGAVDVAWFLRVHGSLGSRRWMQLDEGAMYASTGAGHARARIFADAMMGKVKKSELVGRIRRKRHQDAVRALGLLPLAKGNAREADLLDRYEVIQEFRRGSRQFGSQRQATEKRAAQIGLQNLARTAGFVDPIRLEWAMEAKAVEDLADGPIGIVVEDVAFSLGVDPWGEIELAVTREGRALADVPAKLRKHPEVAALRERRIELKRQAARIRPALEQFMVRGDEFTGAELSELMGHPLLRPMLSNLVLVGDAVAGYPVQGGRVLEDHAGGVEPVKASERLRIAHPHDLLPAASWHRWQKDCFARERIQPFKQVFRELYPMTPSEGREGKQTRRFAGHQLQPRQAMALLGGRGWVNHPEEGVRKVFHEAGLVAWLTFQEGFLTPADVDGLTLESVYFTRRGDHRPLQIHGLPPRLFSETMRDLDLVVSVAHRGGVDPEASASTIEMRATLVGETCRLLRISNVHVKDRYALVKGELGEYSIHLGSGVTRKMPGETLFIVPVHSQHRGRLFLPFADDDPRTAEVVSKVLLLARDREIKDPGILDQLRGG